MKHLSISAIFTAILIWPSLLMSETVLTNETSSDQIISNVNELSYVYTGLVGNVAVIKDVSNKTFYVKVGSKLGANLTIRVILKDYIVVTSEERESIIQRNKWPGNFDYEYSEQEQIQRNKGIYVEPIQDISRICKSIDDPKTLELAGCNKAPKEGKDDSTKSSKTTTETKQ